MRFFLVLLSIIMINSGCITRKKHKTIVDEQIQILRTQIDSLNNRMAFLTSQANQMDSLLQMEKERSKSDRSKSAAKIKNLKKVCSEQDYSNMAVHIYSFCKYVQWPSSFQSNNITICVAGNSPIIDKLKNYTNDKKIGNKKLIVKKYDPSDKTLFHILYIPEEQAGKFSSFKNQLKYSPTLFVTDDAELYKEGAHISFAFSNDKVKYILNKTIAEKAGLKISQDLVKYALVSY